LPTLAILSESLADLCKGAENVDPILHSFKNAEHVRVGVRDVLGKDDIRSTHAALSDIAEACLKQIANREYQKLVDKFGVPLIGRPTEEELSNDIVRGYWRSSPRATVTSASPSSLPLANWAAASRTTTATST